MPAFNSAQTAVAQWRPSWGPGSLPAARRDGLEPMSAPALRSASQRILGVPGEASWRQRHDRSDGRRILASRWQAVAGEHSKAADADFATIAISLRPTNASLSVNGRCIHDGKVPAGLAVLTPAGASSTVSFRSSCDILHLFVPRQRLFTIASEIDGGAASGIETPAVSAPDPVVERLAWLLLKAGDHDAGSSALYIDAIAVAIASRLLLGRSTNGTPGGAGRGLVKWRLKRVQDFVEAQLSEPLSLEDLASCAGLSRMHFAAKFRAATGMRPHEYLVYRRIQRAQEMLLSTTMPLVEVALSVGFQTQAHFTTVFRRLLGETPGRWRQAQRSSGEASQAMDGEMLQSRERCYSC